MILEVRSAPRLVIQRVKDFSWY